MAAFVSAPDLTLTHPVTSIDLPTGGRLDAAAVLSLREPVSSAVADGPVLVLLDVSGVDGVSPSGVAGLLDLLRVVRSRGGDLRIFGASAALQHAFTALRLDTVTRIYGGHDEARGLLASRAS
ncbi:MULTISPECIES: STAS domain-containing protein [Oerskovia]|uniref:STAS domain-containing protein n=2 Tax=Oerskovia TaxID=162491 RepID=A0ABR8UYT0_9CELL|nr:MULTISPECIES: STAS domain-containing protein [Oerskovia]MBD7997708.1 STAS domain-containing protein [Oerskovia gallyi]MBM7496595.1 anti-anti-sigma factor [Oerskovia paurometabola]